MFITLVKNKTGLKASTLYLSVFFLMSCFFTNAQDSIQNKYYKNFNTSWTAEIPIWIPGLRGSLSYGRIDTGNPSDGEDTDFERVNNNSGLKFYFNGGLSKRFNRFWISIDAFSGKVGSQFSYSPESSSTEVELVDITVSVTSPRLTLGYSIFKSTDENELVLEFVPYTGLRYANFSLRSDVFNTSEIIDLNPNWLEPILGLYVPITYKRFRLDIQGDYGWRDRNNYTIAFQSRLRYRFSRLIDMALGVSTMDFNYLDTLDQEELEFDLGLVGPTLAVSFNF